MRSIRPRLMFGLLFGGALLGGCASSTPAGTSSPKVAPSSSAHAPRALSPEALALRAQGPRGLAVALERLQALGAKATPEETAKARALVDDVAQQKDADLSRLYWFTNLEDAKRAAQVSGKPILSLRLLGALTDEYSCANSRFFRVILYPDPSVQKALSEGYVLHWSSEREAPIITIDYRDGRTVTRTITGNSIHYVLDAQGKPLDAMPGLIAPEAFTTWLSEAKALHASFQTQGEAALRAYHERGFSVNQARFSLLASRSGLNMDFPLEAPPPDPNQPPSAVLAMPVAPSKMAVERPLVRAALPSVPSQGPVSDLERVPWSKFETAFRPSVALSTEAKAAIKRKHPQNWADPKAPRDLTAAEFEALVMSFESSLAEDTAKNTVGLHALVHTWFLGESRVRTFDELNKKVYSVLFLTPKSDPWLGLVPARAFSGIDRDGVQSPR